MSKNAETAMELFNNGFNCAQSTLASFPDETGISRDALLKMTAGFGGGIAGRREMCGAVTGMLMAAGLIFGNDEVLEPSDKSAMTGRMRTLINKFENATGCVSCRDLLKNIPAGQSQREYCGGLVGIAADIIAGEASCSGEPEE